MRYITTLTAVAVLFLWPVASLAAGLERPEVQKELKKFQGTWQMASGEMDGKKAADEHVKQGKIVYEGNKIQIVVPNQTGETIIADIIDIDLTKNPKEMHFVRRNGPNAGKTLIGIYEFEGNDQYKFAFDPAGKTTLKEFVTKEGTGHVRNTWKRLLP